MFYYKHIGTDGDIEQVESRSCAAYNPPATMVAITAAEYNELMAALMPPDETVTGEV